MDLMTVLRALADRLTAYVAIALGLVALLIGYLGVRGTAYVVEQVPYLISGGLLGLFLLGLGAVLLLSADLRDQWRALLDNRDEVAAAREQGVVVPLQPAHRSDAEQSAPPVRTAARTAPEPAVAAEVPAAAEPETEALVGRTPRPRRTAAARRQAPRP
jgi:hypothetical protein